MDLKLDDWGRHYSKASAQGVFVAHKDKKFRDILDGQSNTIMAGEIATDLGDRAINRYKHPLRITRSRHCWLGLATKTTLGSDASAEHMLYPSCSFMEDVDALLL